MYNSLPFNFIVQFLTIALFEAVKCDKLVVLLVFSDWNRKQQSEVLDFEADTSFYYFIMAEISEGFPLFSPFILYFLHLCER